MADRQQFLKIGAMAVVGLWAGQYVVNSWMLEPIRLREAQRDEVAAKVSQKDDQSIELMRTVGKFKDWKAMSLPPDPPATAKKAIATALIGHRVYQEWLLDLANLCAFEELSVKLGPSRARGSVYVSVAVIIEAQARHEQLCRFLDLFERTALLQRIDKLRVESSQADGDPLMKVSITAEGLVLVDAAPRRTLFARTSLTEDLTDSGDTLKIKTAPEFPVKPGFIVRIGTELCEVTALTDGAWTVRRGAERTAAAAHEAGVTVELQPRRADRSLPSDADWKTVVAQSLFVKPAPPLQYQPKITPPGEQFAVRGKGTDFTLTVTGYNASLGKPTFVVSAGAPAGLTVEAATGKVSWKPPESLKAGKYTGTVEIRHPSATGGKVLQKLDLVARDPNTPPEHDKSPAPVVYLGKPWRAQPPIKDAESPVSKLKVQLGENPPEGLTLDETSGELTWTPPESLKPGEVTVNLTVTDVGEPPETAKISFPVKVEEDYAQFTRLAGIVGVDGVQEAWLRDRLREQTQYLKAGETFDVSGIKGTVESIAYDSIVVKLPAARKELLVGQDLRSLDTAPALPAPPETDAPADAARPVNTVPAGGLRSAAR